MRHGGGLAGTMWEIKPGRLSRDAPLTAHGRAIYALLTAGLDRVDGALEGLLSVTRVAVIDPQPAVRTGLVLLLPHFVRSTLDFGVPWGRVVHTSRVSRAAHLGDGLRGYLEQLPADLAGWPAAVAAIAGLLALARHLGRSARTGGLTVRARGLVFLLLPAVAHFVLMGLAAPAETRFVLLPLALLIIAGGIAAADAIGLVDRHLSRPAAAVACMLGLVTLGWVAVGVAGERHEHRQGQVEQRMVLVESSQYLRDHADGECGVLSSYVPQITWYGRCETYEFKDAGIVDHEQRFLLLIERGKRHPEGAELDAFLSCVEDEPAARFAERPGLYGAAEMYRFREDPPATCPAPGG
jgi:hypothetical protein